MSPVALCAVAVAAFLGALAVTLWSEAGAAVFIATALSGVADCF